MWPTLLFALLAAILAGVSDCDAAIKKKTPITEGGPDLPYSCATVRWAAALFSVDQLEAMGRANGVTLSRKQRRQAAACIRGE